MPYFATKDNVNLYYEEKGQGKCVVLIHGWSCNRHFFKEQVTKLAKNYKVITYDLRGHGDSGKPEYGLTMNRFATDLKELIEYLNLSDVALVGWSMGTHIIFEYIKNYGSDNLDKLCFIDMTPKLIRDNDWEGSSYGAFSHQHNLNFLANMCEDWNNFAKGFVPRMFAKSKSDNQKQIEWALTEAKKNTPHAMINMWIAMTSQDYRSLLPNISVPCLITHGQESYFYPPAVSQYLKNNISNSKLISFEDCGHSLHLEQADKFNQELIKFLG